MLASLQSNKEGQKEKSTTAGFEPARGDPSRFLVYRLNHSATSSCIYARSLVNEWVRLKKCVLFVGCFRGGAARWLGVVACGLLHLYVSMAKRWKVLHLQELHVENQGRAGWDPVVMRSDQ